jgi:hypothetical protein
MSREVTQMIHIPKILGSNMGLKPSIQPRMGTPTGLSFYTIHAKQNHDNYCICILTLEELY